MVTETGHQPLTLLVILLASVIAAPSSPANASPDSPSPDSLLTLARISNEEGRFGDAVSYHDAAFPELARRYGDAHPRTVEAAIAFSKCLANQAEYDRAESLLRRLLERTRRAGETPDGRSGRLMLALAEVVDALGRDVEGTRLYREAAVIIEEAYGPDHMYTASALSGVAHTKRRMGDSPGAEALYRRCLEIVENQPGAPPSDAVHYRSQLAMSSYEHHHDAAVSLAIADRAVTDATAIFGPDSYQTALEARHRGLLLNGLRHYTEARNVLLRALDVLERVFGPDHPYLSKAYKGVAMACSELHEYGDARRYIDRAIAVQEHAAGRDRYELAYLYGWRADIEFHLGLTLKSVETMLRAADLSNSVLDQIFQVTSSREAILYATRSQAQARALVGMVEGCPDIPDSIRVQVFARVMTVHDQILARLAERHRFLGRGGNPERVERARAAYALSSRRFAELATGADGDSPPARRAAKTNALSRMEEAERELNTALGGATLQALSSTHGGRLRPEVVGAALPAGSALFHFVEFAKRDRQGASGDTHRGSHYGVFSLRPTPAGGFDLRFVDLGASTFIDSLIFSYRAAIDQVGPGRRPTTREEADYRRVARDLYDRVWAPLVNRNGGPETVFLIPVSWLHTVDFNALLGPGNELVIERWRLHHLSYAGQLLRAPGDERPGRGLLAVGNPRYVPSPHGENNPTTLPGTCVDAEVAAAALPGTEREVSGIAALFQSTTSEPVCVLSGPDADEEAVTTQIPGHRIAHFATHGFFCGEDTRETLPYVSRIVDPLLHAGLILSNQRGDGIFSAQEITCLDLTSLDWVVLSACGSGLGRLVQGEGVFGLARAFQIAGARTVISTLWEIPDAQTVGLMSDIYRSRLEGAPTIDAVRDAQLARLREVRGRFNRVHPILWGGVRAQGDWR